MVFLTRLQRKLILQHWFTGDRVLDKVVYQLLYGEAELNGIAVGDWVYTVNPAGEGYVEHVYPKDICPFCVRLGDGYRSWFLAKEVSLESPQVPYGVIFSDEDTPEIDPIIIIGGSDDNPTD